MTAPDAIRSRRAFRNALMRWYAEHHRKLPWRTRPSLYRTVVSEFMLQQTQVSTVLPYFAAWMQKFPDFKKLADANEESVVKSWEGLGYYRRARNLHALAKAYVAASPKPKTTAQWQAMPGVGPYTAAAIASISHDEEAAVIDGNVVRILTRIFADGTEYKDAGSAGKVLKPLADKLIAGATNPGDHNQAMMELGATICTRGRPLCLLCPVRIHCKGWASGTPEKWPLLAKRKISKVIIERCWVVRDGQILLLKAPADAPRLAGLYELPEASLLAYDPAKDKPLFTKKRGIANERIEERIYEAETKLVDTSSPHLRWVKLDKLDSITLSGPHKRWIGELLK